MRRFVAGLLQLETLSEQRKKIKTVPHVFKLLFAVLIDVMKQEQFKNNEAQVLVVQKLKNNERRPKFTGPYKKKRVSS